MASETPIHFPSEGRQLFGLLHTPEKARSVGLLVVNSRVEYRLGPHRFFVDAARAWADLGFHVLRIDHPGNGDSPGDETYPHMDSFPVQPAIDAEKRLRAEGVDTIAMVGTCMGARNALFAAAAIPEIRHLVAIAMPFSNTTPFYAQNEKMATESISRSTARSGLTGYLARLASLESWKRLFSGESDYGVILRLLRSYVGIGRNAVFKEPVYLSLRTFLERGGKTFFAFGTNDLFLPDFQEQFGRVQKRLPGAEALCELGLVEGANHTFSRVVWKQRTIDSVSNWLDREFPHP